MSGETYNDFKQTHEEILPVRLPHDLEVPQPWGMIAKGDAITRYFAHDIAILKARHNLYGQTCSVALGMMQPNAFHRPYIRHATRLSIVIDKWCMRAYKVIEGTFSCVRNDKLLSCNAGSDYVIVGEDDIFSFQAGPKGCVFAIIDFPEFKPGIDINEIF